MTYKSKNLGFGNNSRYRCSAYNGHTVIMRVPRQKKLLELRLESKSENTDHSQIFCKLFFKTGQKFARHSHIKHVWMIEKNVCLRRHDRNFRRKFFERKFLRRKLLAPCEEGTKTQCKKLDGITSSCRICRYTIYMFFKMLS